jgi:C1A family cysteine protease
MFKYQSLHLLLDKFDARDHIYTHQLTLTRTPALVDLRKWASPIEDQGSLGSCTGQAIAGAIELIGRKNSKIHDVSRLFIYYQERVLIGTVHYDSGAYIRDGIKVTYTHGAPLERFWPYDINRFKIKPTANAYSDAKKRRVTGYKRCLDFKTVKSAVAAGNPVVFGFNVYTSFNNINRTGIMTYPNKARERFLGGHAVCIVGYRDIDSRFIVRNSWGPGWGDNGYFYLPYAYFTNRNLSDDFWTIRKIEL